MRLFKRPAIELTPEAEHAESERPEDADAEKPKPTEKERLRSDLGLAMAQYGARGDAALDTEENAVVISEDSPMVRLANTILQQAIKEGASQILIEPDARGLRVRYRVDGHLHETMTMPSYLKPLIWRYRSLANMNLLPFCSPQSGCIAISYESVPYDVRVSSTPSLHGEYLSMRILDKRHALVGLNKLGMTTEV